MITNNKPKTSISWYNFYWSTCVKWLRGATCHTDTFVATLHYPLLDKGSTKGKFHTVVHCRNIILGIWMVLCLHRVDEDTFLNMLFCCLNTAAWQVNCSWQATASFKMLNAHFTLAGRWYQFKVQITVWKKRKMCIFNLPLQRPLTP